MGAALCCLNRFNSLPMLRLTFKSRFPGTKMSKTMYKTTKWPEYNQALVNRGLIIFWVDEEAIKSWECQSHQGRRGRSIVVNTKWSKFVLRAPANTVLDRTNLVAFISSIMLKLVLIWQVAFTSCLNRDSEFIGSIH